MKKILLFIFALFITQFIYGQGFSIDDFDVKIEVSQNGSMTIIESIDVDFSEDKHGIFRKIPYKYNVKGKNYALNITKVSVDNHTYKVSSKDGNKIIKIGDGNVYVNGDQSYIIRYTVDGAILAQEGYQEIYWNITGNEWIATIDDASFDIELPQRLSIPSSDLKVFTGVEGEEFKNATISYNRDHISGVTTRSLQSGEGVTVAIKLPPNYLNLPERTEIKPIEINWWSGFLPGSLLIGLIGFWRNMKSKNKIGDDDVTEESYPPKGFTSAQVGAFVDHKVDDRDVVSLIPYWASEGYIVLKGLYKDVQIQKLKDLPETYPSYEIDFFNALFKEDDITSLSLLKNKTYQSYHKIKSELHKEVRSQDFYDDNYKYWFNSWRTVAFGITLLISGIVALITAYAIPIGIGAIVLGITSLILMAFTPPMSDRGWELNRRLKGLKKFLETPDQDKLDEIIKKDPDYFNKILPYAVAFGLDEKWMVKFEKYYDAAPYWYIPYHGQSGMAGFSNFSSSFNVKEITSAFKSAPAGTSPGGGGFSGGSAGGGFGGGGGGSW